MLFKLLLLNLTLSMIFCLTSHPLSIGLILMLQTILVSLITGILNVNYWFSYMLFLVMVGGMLVLFIYMTSVASNEKFKINKWMILMGLISSFLWFNSSLIDNFYCFLIKFSNEKFMFSILEMQKISLNKYMNYPNISIMMMLILYLLITLIIVVKMTNLKSGPIRQKF